MKIKVCGVCRPADAAAAAAAGAGYVGVVLTPGFPRTRGLAEAAQIHAAAGDAKRVGVFVDPSPAELRAALEQLSLDVVQLHGAESPAQVREARRHAEVWKAVRARTREDFLQAVREYGDSADALLVEGHGARAGGTGARFPWVEIAPARDALPAQLKLVVAGGLTPDNVARAVELLRPDVVDVSSGVEAAPGEKAPELIADFVAAARAAAGERA